MDYKTAKALKDSGFPQDNRADISKITPELAEMNKKSFESSGVILIPNQDPYIPTLTELIEACGEEFCGLDRDKDSDTGEIYFSAKAWSLSKNLVGPTPKEAVAKLWLALNSKSSSK